MERIGFNYLNLAIIGALLLSVTVMTSAKMEMEPSEVKFIVEEVIMKEPNNLKLIEIEQGLKCKRGGESCHPFNDPCCNGFVCMMGEYYCL